MTAVDEDGLTLLHLAVQSTPLHWAIQEENVDLARLLVEHGVDVTAKDYDNLTPLNLAVQVGSVDLRSLLVENGANVKAKDKDRSTPLHLAVQEGREGLARLLRVAGHGARYNHGRLSRIT